MRITDSQILAAFYQFFEEADSEVLAQLAGEWFGGECEFVDDETYEFIPNDNYYGAFGDTVE